MFRYILLIFGVGIYHHSVVAAHLEDQMTEDRFLLTLLEIGASANMQEPGTYQSRFVDESNEQEVKKILSDFANSDQRLVTPQLWKEFVAWHMAVNKEKGAPPEIRQHVLQQSLLALVERAITKSTSQSSSDLKLKVLFRDDDENLTLKAFRALHDASFTLHIPLARALNRAGDQPQNFPELLEDELRSGYWRDLDFSAAMRELKAYFYYEFLVARQNTLFAQTYPLLRLCTPESLANQFFAHFFLHLFVQPFLVHQKVSAKLTQSGNIAVIFDADPVDTRPFEEKFPTWSRVVALITQEDKQLSSTSISETESDDGLLTDAEELSKRHLFHGKVDSSSSLTADTKVAIQELNNSYDKSKRKNSTSTVNKLLREYVDAVQINPAITISTQDLVKKYIALIVNLPADTISGVDGVHAQFERLQDVIRSYDYWHSGFHKRIFFKQYSGNLVDYLEAFSDANWAEKVDFLRQMIKMPEAISDRDIKSVVDSLAEMLAHYVEYLYDDEIAILLQILFDLDRIDALNYVATFLRKIEPLSRNRGGFADILQKLSSKVAPPNIAASSQFHSKRKLQQELSIRLPRENRKGSGVTIKFPIDKGIGEIAQALKDSPLFIGIDDSLLRIIARLAVRKQVKSGNYLCCQGEFARSLLVVTRGKLRVLVNNGHGVNREVATLSKGQLVGDMSLFVEGAERSATVQADEATILYEISREDFRQLMMVDARLMQITFANLAKKVVAGQAALRKNGLFVPEKEISPLACLKNHRYSKKLCRLEQKVKKLRKGKRFIANGANADCLFYIEDGYVTLGTICGQRVECGSYIDEINFFVADGCHPQDVFLPKQDKCSLFFITRKEFDEMTELHPEILWSMAAKLSEMIQVHNNYLKNPSSYRLQIACEQNDVTKAKEALENNVDVNAPCSVQTGLSKDARPVHIAARYNSLQVFTYLVAQGANMLQKDCRNNTPAHIAAEHGNLDILKYLNESGVNFDVHNLDNERPIQLAKKKGYRDIVKYLLGIGHRLK